MVITSIFTTIIYCNTDGPRGERPKNHLDILVQWQYNAIF